MSKERQLYRETYRKGALRLNQQSLPVLKHKSSEGTDFIASECHLLAAGVVERDGEQIEYQDLRVFLKPTP